MSRTIKDTPYEVQERLRAHEAWRFKGYPPYVGGAWPGRTYFANRRNRQYRQQAKLAIKLGQELPINIRCVAWDIW